MHTLAVVFEAPERLSLSQVELVAPTADDVVVDVHWSGISTGTERLMWSGRMPAFPGMGYPLIPGYESVGLVADAPETSRFKVGDAVFVPGSRGFQGVRGLFGGAAKRIVAPAARVAPLPQIDGTEGVLLALAATAWHAFAANQQPDLIIGHGVLGRLIARIAAVHAAEQGYAPPTVHELNPARRTGAVDYAVLDPADDSRRDYRVICDVSGDATLVDALIQRLAPGGEIVLAGFYERPISFAFPPAFMKEARLRVAAEWRPADLASVSDWVASGRLSLAHLITDIRPASSAATAYAAAFENAHCLKMVLDWRNVT
jgi:3-hydroxyethyl bacteriochlorophyllide a dehydrogenase